MYLLFKIQSVYTNVHTHTHTHTHTHMHTQEKQKVIGPNTVAYLNVDTAVAGT